MILLAGAALAGWSNWKSRQSRDSLDPQLVPYNALQFIGLIIIFLMAAHLITLITGKPFTGRRGF